MAELEALNNSEALKTDSPESVAKLMASGMPDVAPYVAKPQSIGTLPPKKPETPLKTSPAATKGKTDRYGREFNPKYHRVDDSGNPVITRNGNLQLLEKRGRKSKNAHKTAGVNRLDAHHIGGEETAKAQRIESEQQAKQAEMAQQAAKMASERRFTAEMMVNTFIGIGKAAFDPDEWEPMSIGDYSERDGLVETTDKWLETQGVADLPAGWALVFAFGSYAALRIPQEKTSAKIKGLISLAKGARNQPKKMAIPTRQQYEQAQKANQAEAGQGDTTDEGNFIKASSVGLNVTGIDQV